MSDEPESLTLVYLRRLDLKMDRIIDDVQDLKRRMTSVERQLADVRVDIAGVSGRLDRIEVRLDHLERHADILPA